MNTSTALVMASGGDGSIELHYIAIPTYFLGIITLALIVVTIWSSDRMVTAIKMGTQNITRAILGRRGRDSSDALTGEVVHSRTEEDTHVLPSNLIDVNSLKTATEHFGLQKAGKGNLWPISMD